MIETFVALFAAHVLADYVFQSGIMAANKHRLAHLALHGLVVLLTATLITGTFGAPVVVLTALHVTTDAIKARAGQTIAAHLADQLAHLITLALIALAVPDLWHSGIWANGQLAPAPVWLPHGLLLIFGAIYATRAGGFAVGLLMAPYGPEFSADSLPGGGKMIGLLERGLIYVLTLAGLPIGIGFLIAAKSVLRFESPKEGAIAENRKRSEYVIIGTLASFGWAILVSLAVVFLLGQLPDLGID
ncbi:DUF3307 domain-containing protein [Cognatishimia sp. SS12]|uniref:DUF3307 domain-containing protein n=1 Tax=Cognatishimia sp. SS12 TaxID=2979465 RepID=UPI0023310B3D|nr:DUF3307 domain-containing protein [Cognatishimia sp. SS12]MDC0737375.1 DUF3307 domain-containing protein [Cognatishimia sp. SS12]